MQRLWELDFFRGTAVALMLVFNYAFALRYLNIMEFGESWLFWWLFPRLIAGMFILIAGISVTINAKNKTWTNYFQRGARIFFLGILITITTLVFTASPILFGILHFLAVAIALSPLFLKMKPNLLLLASLIILFVGSFLQTVTVDYDWLFWLGLTPRNFHSLDYFPLLPWTGIFMLGIYAGKKLYRNGKRRFKIKERSPWINFLGRH